MKKLKFIDPYESIGFHSNLTAKAFVKELDFKFAGTGVTSVQFRALVYLFDAGPISLSELVNFLQITKATGTRLVDRMERDELVVRRVDPDDSRIKQLVVTATAEEVYDKVYDISREVLRKAYEGINPDDIELTKRILTKIRKNLEK